MTGKHGPRPDDLCQVFRSLKESGCFRIWLRIVREKQFLSRR